MNNQYLSSFLTYKPVQEYTDLTVTVATDTIGRTASGPAFDTLFSVGDTITLTTNNANTFAGPYTIASVTATTIVVNEDLTGSDVASTTETITVTAGGLFDLTGNYTSEVFADFRVPTGKIALIKSMVINIEDATSSISSTVYGGLAAALTNGIRFEIAENGTATDTLGLVKSNADYASYACRFESLGLGTTPANTFIRVSHNWGEAGTPLLLDGDQNDSFRISLNDDFSGLSVHTVYIGGVLLTKSRKTIETLENNGIW